MIRITDQQADCAWCGNQFIKTRSTKRFCSKRCGNADWASNHSPRERDPKLRRIYSERYRAKNPEKVREAKKRWALANRERLREANAKWHAENRDKKRIRAAAWHATNKEITKERNAKWYAANPEFSRAKHRRRRAFERQTLSETYTSLEIFERDRWVCGICGTRVNRKLKSPNPKSASIDHIIPLGPNGPDIRANVQLAHRGCNSAKSNRTLPKGEQLRLI